MVDDISYEDELADLREKRLRDLNGGVNVPARPPGTVIEVTDMNIGDLIHAHHYLVVDCWTEWCGPCMTIAPVIDELAAEFAGTVTIGKCDADMNLETMQAFQISAIPTLLFFANGSLAGRLTGAHSGGAIRTSLLRVFGL
ncbi:co-chaperone YbbN [Methanogenium sp. MK-MG]|uniref:thioredoxin family protein n=1 Tax=Methanogenium sp. MK-MG TaxID=2599926 RepID=UPI0013E9ACEE|nr:thioredoxin domain-containing protein [Methanogenium sp. MK-MG]